MLSMNADFDSRETEIFLGRFAKQVPFALSEGINKTLEDAQFVQLAHQFRTFDVKKRNFMERSTKKQRATKRTLTGTLRIDPPKRKGKSTADILTKFEEDTVKHAKPSLHVEHPSQGHHIAVPINAKRTAKRGIRQDNRPRAFEFKRVGKSWRGKKRTFLIEGEGIYQRTGKKGTKRRRGAGRRLASDVKTRRVRDMNITLLYSLKKSVPIDPDLNFFDNMTVTVKSRFNRNFDKAFDHAVRTAK